MKKLIFFVLVCGVMSGCTYDVYHDLPKDKIPLINNGTVYFKDSATNKIDTLILKRYDYKSTHLEGGINYIYVQILIYYYRPTMKSYFLEYSISTRTATVSGYDFGIDYDLDMHYSGTYKPFSYSIQGKIYPSVYLDYSDSYSNVPDSLPNRVYYTCQNGIIRYEYKDGRVYNLVSK